MSQSIRSIAMQMFMERLPQRKQNGGPLTDLMFRKGILLDLDEITGQKSGASHYNYAFKEAKKTHPELVVNLGRPEGKNNGGRKRKVSPVVEQPKFKYFQPSDILLLTYDPKPDALLQPPLSHLLPPVQPVVQRVTVVRAKDGFVVSTDVSLEDANAMIATAAARKKAKLMIQQ